MPTKVATLQAQQPTMAAEMNGRPAEKGIANGHVVGRTAPVKQRAGFAGKSFSLISRILVWYTIITTLFRCPSSSSDLTEGSPKVCKPYLSVRSHVAPYVEPYYDSYAAPHVEKVWPYLETFNKQVYSPSVKYGKKSYQTHGAPRVDQARVFSQEKWEKILKPQLDTAQVQAQKRYDSNLAPHVSKASAAAEPYYTSSRDSASQIYTTCLLPAFEAARPYIEKSYATGHELIFHKGLPYAKTAWGSTVVFLDRTIWPKMRILYGENVEPQLVRIGERLGRYRDGKKLKAAMEEGNTSSIVSSVSSSFSSVAASVAPTTTDSSSATASPSLTPEQEAEHTREKIESDLKNWQDKFAKAADKGTEDLEERVKDITDRQIKNQVHGVGKALVIQLEESSKSQLAKIKHEIIYLVKNFPEEYDDEDLGKATLSLSRFIRQAGLVVKEKAQALRSWKENFDQETQSLVNAASDSTLDVIDNIRDLGLQEIGLRWAQMEGVTYKDWSKYHEVKKTFDEWRVKVEAVAQEHGGLSKAKDASEEVEARGMGSAEETANELARLKEVGKWKMEAGDLTDDFGTKYTPPAAVAGAQKVMEKIRSASEQVVGTSQGTAESIASLATEKVVGTEPGMADKARGAIVGTPQPKVESVESAAKDKANQAASDASEAVIGTPPPVHESIASQASESVSSASSLVSSSASSATSQASKKVYGGAMAQEVHAQKPILEDNFSDDDDSTYSEKMQSMVNQAGEKYAGTYRPLPVVFL